MATGTQVSAYISEETKAQIDAYVKSRGVKKAFLIEEALQHHLQALRELPEDIIVPTRLVLSDEAIKQLANQMTSAEPPTDALRALFGN